MTIVGLTWSEVALCADVGVMRQVYAFTKDYKLYGNPDGSEALFEHHIAGAISEFAVARFLNLFWKPSIGETDNLDVGGLVEVRMRLIPGTGTDLAMRPKDHDDRPYVQVHLYRTRPHRPEIMGWIYGREGKRPGEPVDPKRLVWFIPPPYRPLSELVEWVNDARRYDEKSQSPE